MVSYLKGGVPCIRVIGYWFRYYLSLIKYRIPSYLAISAVFVLVERGTVDGAHYSFCIRCLHDENTVTTLDGS